MASLNRLQKPVLVLNASYEPINICAARRALVLVLKGVASAEEISRQRRFIRAGTVPLPSVIRLLEYRRIPHQTRALSRKNILMRDRYTCQYCHRTMPSGELTLDHVIPRSRAGESAWENLVACCHPCNNRKGSRTPEEAGMKLLRQPRPFSLHTSRHLMRCWARATSSGGNTCSINNLPPRVILRPGSSICLTEHDQPRFRSPLSRNSGRRSRPDLLAGRRPDSEQTLRRAAITRTISRPCR